MIWWVFFWNLPLNWWKYCQPTLNTVHIALIRMMLLPSTIIGLEWSHFETYITILLSKFIAIMNPKNEAIFSQGNASISLKISYERFQPNCMYKKRVHSSLYVRTFCYLQLWNWLNMNLISQESAGKVNKPTYKCMIIYVCFHILIILRQR